MGDAPTTSYKPPSGDDDDDDSLLIIAFVLFGVGAVLILIGIVKLCLWLCKVRENSKEEKKKIRALDHIRYLEEYSIRTGGSASERNTPKSTPKSTRSHGSDSVFRYDDLAGVNPAYVSETYNGVPRTYLRVTHGSGSSTGQRSPGASPGRYPEVTTLGRASPGLTVAHPSDQHGVARVMVGGEALGTVTSVSSHSPATSPASTPTIIAEVSRVPMDSGSQYSSTDRRKYEDVMF